MQFIPILMYHSITDTIPPRLAPWSVPPAHFDEQMQYLTDNGYQALTVSQFIDRRQLDLPDRPVVVTFDDGFDNFYTTALPILHRYGLTATLYLATAYMGGTSRWLAHDGGGDLRMLTWDQVREACSAGIEIGGHTATHVPLTQVSEDEARREIAGCKQHIEDQIGQQVRSFAYPYGFFSGAVKTLVQAAGYESACAVLYNMSSPTDDAFALARHIVPPDLSLSGFATLIENRAPVLPLAFLRLRSRVYRRVQNTLPLKLLRNARAGDKS